MKWESEDTAHIHTLTQTHTDIGAQTHTHTYTHTYTMRSCSEQRPCIQNVHLINSIFKQSGCWTLTLSFLGVFFHYQWLHPLCCRQIALRRKQHVCTHTYTLWTITFLCGVACCVMAKGKLWAPFSCVFSQREASLWIHSSLEHRGTLDLLWSKEKKYIYTKQRHGSDRDRGSMGIKERKRVANSYISKLVKYDFHVLCNTLSECFLKVHIHFTSL